MNKETNKINNSY